MGSPAARLLPAAVLALAMTLPAAAEGDRTLALHNMNTGESLEVTYKRGGRYDEAGLAKLDWFLRDWRRGESVRMETRLYDVVWDIYRQSGATAPIQVHSGYRSRETNSLLRKRSKAVAEHSQHSNGAAMDFHIPGVSASKLRAIAMRMEDGGVGFYPRANFPFVHVDVANVRHWPKMDRSQLMALFPDGVSLHVPADGKPLKGFAQALKDIADGTRHAVARLPDEVPFPRFRTDAADAFPPAPGLPVFASSLDLAVPVTGFAAAAYLPSKATTSAYAALMKPETTAGQGYRMDDVVRMSLRPVAAPGTADVATDHGKAPLKDAGVGTKGPRLGGAERIWKIGGYL